MTDLFIEKNYQSKLSIRETEIAIKAIKDYFEHALADALNLQRVSAPLFVRKGSGINDDLNGVERKVAFPIKADGEAPAEVVFSLAKWKRMVLAEYDFGPGEGLYTDMNAIRPDEDSLDNLHSLYVDQWDWERVISPEQRNLVFLKEIVESIYEAIKKTEAMVEGKYPHLKNDLPDKIPFVHTEELAERFPKLTPRQREDAILKELGAAFIIGIGGDMGNGEIHDGRAPDYDDWITPTSEGKRGLNGDIFVWNPLLNRAFELSSMGIRVDRESMLKQLEVRNAGERKNYRWHQRLLNGEFPECVGGGIGQSRLCMFFLQKMHIGEVQCSIWPEDVIEKCKQAGIHLL
jgi:aspartate--ammonia ligase